MERIWTFLVSFFYGKQESNNLNATALVIIIVGLLIALLVSVIVAKKNHLYNSSGSLDENLSDADRTQ